MTIMYNFAIILKEYATKIAYKKIKNARDGSNLFKSFLDYLILYLLRNGWLIGGRLHFLMAQVSEKGMLRQLDNKKLQ